MGFAAAYVLSLYAAVSVSPYAAVRALVVAVVLAASLTCLFWLLFRNVQRGSLAATIVVAAVLFARDLATIVGNAVRLLPNWQVLLLGTLIAAALAVVSRIAWRTVRGEGGMASLTRNLNVLATILLLVIAVTGGLTGAIGWTIDNLRQGVPLSAAPDRSNSVRQGPDIYLILLDGHTRADVLADHFGFDDGAFLDGLNARGFEIAPTSHSNYMFTQLTLTSMFNMKLLQDLPELVPVLASGRVGGIVRRLFNNNPTFDFLHNHGYTTVALATQYEDVVLRQADVFVDVPQLNEFEWQILASTFALDLVDTVTPDVFGTTQRDRINGAFGFLAQVAQDHRLGPKFVFGHVLAPHPPFVFGANGEPVYAAPHQTEDTAAGLGLTNTEFAKRFSAQTAYVDERTLQAIDVILATSPEQPAIIVMSDHGSRSKALDSATATPDDLRERFGTLFAAYTPNRTGVFRSDETPAAVFVDLLNAYFGARLPEPDSGTFLSATGDPYALTQVSEPLGPPR